EVTVVTFGDSDAANKIQNAFRKPPKAVHVVPPPWVDKYRRLGQIYSYFTRESYIQLACSSDEMRRVLDDVLRMQEFDFVLAEFSMMGWYDLNTKAIKLLDAHNIEHDTYLRLSEHARGWIRRAHYLTEYKKLLSQEIKSWRKQDAILVTSERDADVLQRLVPEAIEYVVPNGVDTSYFYPSDATEEPYTLVFTGLMKYVPNYDGMLYFLDEIFPLILREIPSAKLYIVGGFPPKELERRASPNVIITGYVEDVRPYIWRAKAYIVPLRMGGGTRLKVLEAMAMKKIVIGTSIGCEGIDVTSGDSALIADDPKQFAATVVEVLRNPARVETIAANGFEIAKRKYDWKHIGTTIEDILQRLAEPKASVNSIEESVLYE
ncbi:MAG TPA: glycosyltransferase, partial [Bacteroidota bacterium]|nr:glycosyltransferase [Bacteroidota bacterium]